MFKKIISGLIRLYYVMRPSLHQQRVYKGMLHYLDGCDIKYLKDDKQCRILVNMTMEPDTDIEFQYFFDHHRVGALARMQTIPEDQIRDAMMLTAHLNLFLRPSVALVNTDSRSTHLIRYSDMLTCALYPDTIAHEMHAHQVDTQFAAENFECLLRTGDDPVFVVDMVRKKWSRQEQEPKD